MKAAGKIILFIAIGAGAALSSAAASAQDLPPAWSFGGKNSPFISSSDVGFPWSSAKPTVSENSETPEAHY